MDTIYTKAATQKSGGIDKIKESILAGVGPKLLPEQVVWLSEQLNDLIDESHKKGWLDRSGVMERFKPQDIEELLK